VRDKVKLAFWSRFIRIPTSKISAFRVWQYFIDTNIKSLKSTINFSLLRTREFVIELADGSKTCHLQKSIEDATLPVDRYQYRFRP